MNNIPVYTLHLPEYQVLTEPDHVRVGKKVDDYIKQHFLGQHVAIRCLGSSEHAGKAVDEIIAIIIEIGSDRYDPKRQGDRYQNSEGKQIDFFAFDYTVAHDSKIFHIFTWPFYHWRREQTGKPVRIDVIIIYNPAKLKQVTFTYAGRESEGERSDGWVFTDQDNKPEAILGIIKMTGSLQR